MDTWVKVQNIEVVNATALFFLAILSAVVLKTLAFIFIPFTISLLICYALGKPLNFLQRCHVPTFLRIIIIVTFVLMVIYLFGRLVTVNIKELQSQLPMFEEKFWEYTRKILDSLDMTPAEVKEIYESFWGNFQQTRLKPLGSMVKYFSGSFFAFMGNMVWVILFLIFMLAEREGFYDKVRNSFGDQRAEPVIKTLNDINRSVQNYLGLKVLISLFTGILVTLALNFFNTPFALLWGVLAFVLNFIPNIGSMIAGVPPVLLTFFQNGSLSEAFLVIVVFAAIQFCIGNLLEPKLMGKGLNLSPLVVLFSLLFWGWVWGIPGMLLSVPLTAALKIALEKLETTRPMALLMS
ncbi:MAG: AI-2E family transporter [Desulfobia sp.]